MKFAIGDRVAIYLAGPNVIPQRRVGVVETYLDCDGDFLVRILDDGFRLNVKPQQCRRLKPKRRSRLWVKTDGCLTTFEFKLQQYARIVSPPSGEEGWIEFVAVKSKKR